jgi:pantoate--beta-alanine ligase
VDRVRGSDRSSETLIVVNDPREMAEVSRALHVAGHEVAMAPTMGALHAGHLALVEEARKSGGEIVATIFVNPLQFGPNEDFDRYPRTLSADIELLRDTETRYLFAPTAADMYPDGRRTAVTPGPLGAELCGATRPVLFGGMLTVVAKLLQIVQPDTAYFGEKDYQQLVLIRQMVRDLNFPMRIVAVPTVREPDGLAMSSRNQYLGPAERVSALQLFAALEAGARAAAGGAEAALDAARAVLHAADGVEVEYLELRDEELGPAPTAGAARLVLAAWVGGTRLIDNVPVTIGAEGGR